MLDETQENNQNTDNCLSVVKRDGKLTLKGSTLKTISKVSKKVPQKNLNNERFCLR